MVNIGSTLREYSLRHLYNIKNDKEKNTLLNALKDLINKYGGKTVSEEEKSKNRDIRLLNTLNLLEDNKIKTFEDGQLEDFLNSLSDEQVEALRRHYHINPVMVYPEFRPGDTIRVHYRIRDVREIKGKKGAKIAVRFKEATVEIRERVQVFEGVVLGIRGSDVGKTFTVYKVSYGIGVERIFPFYSPFIEKIEIVRYGRVRRAKLYYLKQKVGKKARVKMLQEHRIRKRQGRVYTLPKLA